jgi:hypothetical protein
MFFRTFFFALPTTVVPIASPFLYVTAPIFFAASSPASCAANGFD